jgi:adenylate cyclase, class 2
MQVSWRHLGRTPPCPQASRAPRSPPVPATHEIEVKYRVPDRDALLTTLVARGIQLGPSVEQDDQAYAPDGWCYGDSKLGIPFARLRTQAGRHIFTLKRPVDNELSCIEHETEVSDRQAMHHAILAMGFQATMQITKRRRTVRIGDICLCLDDVDGLGSFLELERIVAADTSATAVQAELAAFVAGLGIEATRTEETYDSLVGAALTTA